MIHSIQFLDSTHSTGHGSPRVPAVELTQETAEGQDDQNRVVVAPVTIWPVSI
jgi:hypothetical protein